MTDRFLLLPLLEDSGIRGGMSYGTSDELGFKATRLRCTYSASTTRN